MNKTKFNYKKLWKDFYEWFYEKTSNRCGECNRFVSHPEWEEQKDIITELIKKQIDIR